MRVFPWIGVVAILLPVASAQENVMRPGAPAAVTRFVKLEAFNFKNLVPPPPAPSSLAAQSELETVLQVQAWRTSEQEAWARSVEKDTVFNHASVVGEWFKPERLPLTAVLFKQIGDDMRALDAAAKKPFLRPRPSTVDPRVRPCVAVPPSTSYPSGAAMQAFVWAELLSELLPSRRQELLERAHRAAWGRVLGGVHFPSDLLAGQLMAAAYLKECRNNRAFQDALENCKRELARAPLSDKAP